MKVVFTGEALAGLDGILAFIAKNYPAIYDAFQSRLQSILTRIGEWPESAQEVADRPDFASCPDPISIQGILSQYRQGD